MMCTIQIRRTAVFMAFSIPAWLSAERAGAQCPPPEHTFHNPAPGADDQFGNAVAVGSTWVAVGAWFDDTGASDAGSVYVFNRGTGALTRTFNNPTPAADDRFGISVAVSGDYVAAGAPSDDSPVADAGSVYLYSAGTGSLLRTINGPVSAAEEFGASVALDQSTLVVGAPDSVISPAGGRVYIYDADTGSLLHNVDNPSTSVYGGFGESVAIHGNYIVAGARFYDSGYQGGRVYIFNAAGSILHTIDNPTPEGGDEFGGAVAVYGNTVLVGAHGDDVGATDSGRAYLFDAATGALLHIINNPTPTYQDDFGNAVAISGNLGIIGARFEDGNGDGEGAVYQIDATTGLITRAIYNPVPTDFDLFGQSVAISGTKIVVGAHLEDTGASAAGSAYLFDAGYPCPTPTPVPTLTPGPTPLCPVEQTFTHPSPSTGDAFGLSVAMEGNNILVGAPFEDTGNFDTGSAYLFSGSTGSLVRTFNNPTPQVEDAFGYAVAISGNGVLIGAPRNDVGSADAGSVYLFDAATGALLRTFDKPSGGGGSVGINLIPTGNDFFGYSVAIDGNYVLIGAPFSGSVNSGTAYLFNAATGALLHQFFAPLSKRAGSGDGPGGIKPDIALPQPELFGTSVAISGTNILIGSPFPGLTGRALLFDAVSGSHIRNFSDPTPVTGDYFGGSVAISGTHVLVGASREDSGASDSGGAYLFDTATGVLLQSYFNPTPAAGDIFGQSVALSGTRVLVGSPGDGVTSTNAGSAYLFDLAGSLLGPYRSPAASVGDYFGISVAVSGDAVLAGSPRNPLTNTGSAYLFSCRIDCELADELMCGDTVSGSTTGASVPTGLSACDTAISAPGVWYRITGNGALMTASTCNPGTNFDTKLHVFTGDCDSLTCLEGNDDSAGCVYGSARSILTWQTVPGVEYHLLVSGYQSSSGSYELSLTCVEPNDACTDAIEVTCAVPVTGSTLLATVDPAAQAAACGPTITAPGVWYSVMGDGAYMTATTCNAGTNYDTKLHVFTGGCAGLNCVAGNDDLDCGIYSTASWQSSPGVEYLILVSGFMSTTGNIELSVDCVYPTATPAATPTNTPVATPTPAPCCPGDADNSGSFVDANDFIAVQANFGADNGVGGPGDANCSGSFVDANDFIAVQASFGADCG